MASDYAQAIATLKRQGYSRQQISDLRDQQRDLNRKGLSGNTILDEARKYGFGKDIQGVSNKGVPAQAGTQVVSGGQDVQVRRFQPADPNGVYMSLEDYQRNQAMVNQIQPNKNVPLSVSTTGTPTNQGYRYNVQLDKIELNQSPAYNAQGAPNYKVPYTNQQKIPEGWRQSDKQTIGYDRQGGFYLASSLEPVSTVTAAKTSSQGGFDLFLEKSAMAADYLQQRSQREQRLGGSPAKAQLFGLASVGVGAVEGVASVASIPFHPVRTVKGVYEFARHPIRGLAYMGEEFQQNPGKFVGSVVGQTIAFNWAGKAGKASLVLGKGGIDKFLYGDPKAMRWYGKPYDSAGFPRPEFNDFATLPVGKTWENVPRQLKVQEPAQATVQLDLAGYRVSDPEINFYYQKRGMPDKSPEWIPPGERDLVKPSPKISRPSNKDLLGYSFKKQFQKTLDGKTIAVFRQPTTNDFPSLNWDKMRSKNNLKLLIGQERAMYELSKPLNEAEEVANTFDYGGGGGDSGSFGKSLLETRLLKQAPKTSLLGRQKPELKLYFIEEEIVPTQKEFKFSVDKTKGFQFSFIPTSKTSAVPRFFVGNRQPARSALMDILSPAQKTEFAFRNVFAAKQISVAKPSTTSRTSTSLLQGLFSEQKQSQQQVQVQEQIQIQKQMLKNMFKKSPKEKPWELPKLEYFGSPDESKYYRQVFALYVRRKGKFGRISNEFFPKEEALRQGFGVTHRTLAASFRIKAVGFGNVPKSKPFSLGNMYYKKKDVFIEKPKFRLNTRTEVGEIMKFPKGRKKKRKGFWF